MWETFTGYDIEVGMKGKPLNGEMLMRAFDEFVASRWKTLHASVDMEAFLELIPHIKKKYSSATIKHNPYGIEVITKDMKISWNSDMGGHIYIEKRR